VSRVLTGALTLGAQPPNAKIKEINTKVIKKVYL